MLKRTLMAMLAASVAVLATVAATAAEHPMLVGVVKVARAGAQEAATIKIGADVYKVVKDANGRKVAAEAQGRAVEIKGPVEERAGVKWIAVTSCKIIEAVPAAPSSRGSR
ncbi:MAG: hypothetical protein NTV49_02655 [Kiritimatiellaeota bacterium]|nr:hypothetical protein [Kiritimatiellota bacterium]